MIIYAQNQSYICGLLEESDFELFYTGASACYGDKDPYEVPDTSKTQMETLTRETNGECWRIMFLDPDIAHFALLNQTASGPVFIGEARVCSYRDRTDIEDLHILTPYRGQRLIDMLYESCLMHIAQTQSHRCFASLSIKHWNTASIRAALRNGFKREASEADSIFPSYSRSLADFRTAQPPTPDNDLY